MSRIGKRILTIPAGVNVELNEHVLTVKGPKGELSLDIIPELDIKIDGNLLTVVKLIENSKTSVMQGTTNSNIENNKENKIKIMEILNMRVPKDYNKGIILSIKYKKFNKIYIEELNSKFVDIPSNNLIKYYEMFICDVFRAQNYSKRLSFD